MRRNQLITEALVMIKAAGYEPGVKINRHVKITWVQGGRLRVLVCSLTPSDWRAIRKVRSDVRRLLNE
jgi:hypothetical protein